MSVTDPIVPDTASFAGKIARRLQLIYGSGFSESHVNLILEICSKRYSPRQKWDEKDSLLITYGDSVHSTGEVPLRSLQRFLHGRLRETISCVHILPFFPYTSDDGFSVTDFMQVNHVLGNWDDISAIQNDFCLMSDLVINHVSASHPWFQNYLKGVSPGTNYFIESREGEDYSKVIRPRNTPLFTAFETSKGTRYVWTTFSDDQVDLNFSNPEILFEIIRVMVFYISKGARFLRLDAIAFLWKRAGTTCLHLDQTHELVRLLRDIAHYICPGTIIITETNVPNLENWSYFGNGDEAHMVYQFSLPPLLLYSMFSCNTTLLTKWAKQIPETLPDQTFLNYTASHDGIGVRPLEGIMPETEIAALIEGMVSFGGMISTRNNNDGSLSPYEINITYLDAMKGTQSGRDSLQEKRFICSQAIMMALKGIPAFYIHSLLATSNDYDGVRTTGRARSINRRKLDLSEINALLAENTMQHRIFTEITDMINIRKAHSAFHPNSHQEVITLDDHVFALMRFNKQTGERIFCVSNISDGPVQLRDVNLQQKKGYDLLSDKKLSLSDPIPLEACQTRWITGQVE